MKFTRLRIAALAVCALFAASTLAWAITSGTTGTAKQYQQSGVRIGVPVMRNLTATASSNAATLNAAGAGIITTEGLSTAAAATYTLTLTDDAIAAADMVFASVQNGSNTTGTPAITTVAPGAGSVVIIVQNVHASTGFSGGTLKISFLVVKQSALDAD